MHVREVRNTRSWRWLRPLIRGLLAVPPVLLFTPNGKHLVVVQQTRLALALDPIDLGQAAAVARREPADFDS